MFNNKIVLLAMASVLFLVGCAGQKKVVARVPTAPTATTTTTHPAIENAPAKKTENVGVCASLPSDADNKMKTVCAFAAQAEAKKKAEEATKLLKSLATPEEKKALDRVAKDEKEQRKRQERTMEAFYQADIRGCADPRTVRVEPQQWSNVKFGPLIPYPWFSVRIYNESGEPVDIDSTERGQIVQNLCQNGALTFIRPHISGVDGTDVYFTLVARGKNGGTMESPQYTLSVYQNSVMVSRTWHIRPLQR